MFTDSLPVPGPSRIPIDYSASISPSARYPLGSPFSLRDSQFYPGCSPGTLMGPLDIPDLKYSCMGSSYESNHGSLMRMLSGETPTANNSIMSSDYTCCGLKLTDLHALVEHFEENHVVVVDDPFGLPMHPAPVSRLPETPMALAQPSVETMDDMDMDMELDIDGSGSGDDSASSSEGDGASTPSPPLTPVLPFDTTAIHRRSALFPSTPPTSPRLESAFNRYAGFTEYSAMLPGAIGVHPSALSNHSRQKSFSRSGCLPPSLLSTPTPSPSVTPPDSPKSSVAVAHTHSSGGPSLTRSSDSPSVPSVAKPFRCPKLGCNKSYKQANGLKYHVQHGSCNFAPRDETIDNMTEKEAELRLKPYQCQVPPCTRRYKNMNGLRYHYQHSGAHGAIGLALLASGQHEHSEQFMSSTAAGSGGASHVHRRAGRLSHSVSGTPSSSRNTSARSSPAPPESSAFRNIDIPMVA